MKIDRLSLNSEPLDKLLDGGLEHNSITNIYGPPGSGKSNIALQACVQSIDSGKKAVFIDTEGGFSVERLSQISQNTEKYIKNIILFEPRSFEEQYKIVMKRLEKVLEKHEVGLVVIDSLVTLYRLELEGDKIQDVNRKLAKQLSKLSDLSRAKHFPVLVTNQIYSNIENGGIELSGRSIPGYMCKTLVRIKKLEKGKRIARVTKHRSIPEGKETEFVITEKGIERA